MSRFISNTKGQYENHLDENTPKWFAVYTHYKREKIAVSYLEQTGIETYLPIQTFKRVYTKKVKKVDLPLINHYIFVKITKQEYVRILQCPYVVKFVKFSNNLISIPEKEIELIKRILGELDSVNLGHALFQKGDQVEVIGGNLTGLKGTLIKKENNQYLSVELRNIGISLNVSIATHLLRKVNTSFIV